MMLDTIIAAIILKMETWEIRLAQAKKFDDWSQALSDANRVEGAFYLSHMSVELILKSVIAKNSNGWHPRDSKSHNLMQLISDKRTQFLFVDMARDQNSNIHAQFLQLNSQQAAWEMQYRYEGTKLSDAQMNQSVGIYREIFKWTLKNYVQ